MEFHCDGGGEGGGGWGPLRNQHIMLLSTRKLDGPELEFPEVWSNSKKYYHGREKLYGPFWVLILSGTTQY